MSRQIAAVAALALTVACGGGGNPAGPSPGGGSPGPSGATITITPNGVNPSTVTINSGESVTFINNDTRGRRMTSNPHPTHTDCPAINALGLLNPGQTAQTSALTTSRTCGFHDHDDDTNTSMRGSIVIR